MANAYETGLDRNAANFQPLTPITLLERAAATFPEHTAIIHGSAKTSYREFWRRSLKLGSALAKLGIGKGDTVTVMLSNTPADAGGPFRRADDQGRAAFAEHPARCRDHRLPARPCRDARSSSSTANSRA